MFYVSIEKGVLDKVMERARKTDNEIIGILVGSIEDHTIVISDAVSGVHESGETMATLPPKTIAKVTDKILTGEIEGRIVGWYHSHPGFGIFMSRTDVNTQQNLQQFSSKVTALIVDAESEKYGFFTLHGLEGAVQLDKDQVHVFEEGGESIPERFSEPPQPPKPKRKSNLRSTLPPLPPPQSRGANMKLIAVSIAAALMFMAIAGMIFVRNTGNDVEYPKVNAVTLHGHQNRSQMGVPIFREFMGVSSNITIIDNPVTAEGLRFYISNAGRWDFIQNQTANVNFTYEIEVNTSLYVDGVHKFKVNFTDTKNRTWEKESVVFIIDNTPDPPHVKVIDPEVDDVLDGVVEIIAKITDPENNIHNVTFSRRVLGSVNWSIVNKTEQGKFVYVCDFNTHEVVNGTYEIQVRAEDRNRYIYEMDITVTVIHGG